MEADDSADFFDENKRPNRKQSVVDPFKDLCTNPFVSSINLLVQAPVEPNSKWYWLGFIPSSPHWISRNIRYPIIDQSTVLKSTQVVPACRRYNKSDVSPPSMLCEILLHSWTHPQP